MIGGSVLDKEVSIYTGALNSTKSGEVNLLRFLTDPNPEYLALVDALRSLDDSEKRQEFKKYKLPAITPSGTFDNPRSQSNLINHTGLIQLDVDGKDNPGIDMVEMKRELSNLKQAAYIGFSSSGRGLWGLFPIKDVQRHKEHFIWFADWIEAYFNLVVDRAPSNQASLRFYSFDPDAYINHNAETINQYHKPKAKRYQPTSSPDQIRERIDACVQQIITRGIDITGDYHQWLRVGYALANTLGEDGREIFNAISVYSPSYGKGRTPDEQYDYCLKSNIPGHEIGIGTFFQLCDNSGVRFNL